ncbi:MAG: hypothetical protein KDK05_03885 [Candidatus Competibacteraceae bacterium]|nr:hypothetical protein [Candidatus Competibacteraceae bacterium]
MKLSPIQAGVMKWANGGWVLYQVGGSSIHVNTERICNRATVDALVKRKLLVPVGQYQWKAPQHVKADEQ